MNDELLKWLLGGFAAFGLYELRQIRDSIEKMRDSIEKLSNNDANHAVRLDKLEETLQGRPCVVGSKGRCES